jgi:hypothetical protein
VMQPGRRGDQRQSQGADPPKRGPDPDTTVADRPQNRLDLRRRDGNSGSRERVGMERMPQEVAGGIYYDIPLFNQ